MTSDAGERRFDADRTALALLDARRGRAPAGPLSADLAPRDVGEAAAVQVAMARRLNAYPPGGFKIGATGARMRAYLGLEGPAAGFMEARNILPSGAEFEFSDYRHPAVECELAVRLAHDLPPAPCDLERARAAVGALFAAIEVVENRYGVSPSGDPKAGNLKAVGTPTLIADQVYHRACVTGEPGDWASLDLVAIDGRMSVDGILRADGQGVELLENPIECLAWIAGSEVAAAFGGLRAGQVVMLGSVTPPLWLDGPCAVEVAFSGLPPVSLRFR